MPTNEQSEREQRISEAEKKLDLTYYCGSDLYSDGEVEDELLEASVYPEKLEEHLMNCSSWAHLYHLSPIRRHILEWYDFDKTGSVLEIGSGCGAITGLLCEKTDHVVGIDLSKKRSLINACRNKDCDNLKIMVGNFEDINIEEKFDYVTLIGVFEYSICYIGSESPFEDMLEKAKGYLKPGGKLIIAIENKYGLKYFSGASEDHTGRLFDGIENYVASDRVRTFSRHSITCLLEKQGFESNEFYYPLPDYKLPTEIYSDRRLPGKGSIRNACISYDRDRYELFDERLAFDSLCEDGMFRDMANSFLIISSIVPDEEEKTCIYAKYNRLRSPEFRLSTRILKNKSGELYVEKRALGKEGEAHIKVMADNKKLLDCNLDCNKEKNVDITVSEDTAVFPFIKGSGLEKSVFNSLSSKEKFNNAVNKAVVRIYGEDRERNLQGEDFVITPEFIKIFGEPSEEEKTLLSTFKCDKSSNIDRIFSNYIECEDNLICLDYEWVYDFPIPRYYCIYRTLIEFYRDNLAYTQKYISENDYLADYGITEEMKCLFERMDDSFQQYVHGKNRRYVYTHNYEKTVINIGKNFQNNEPWFRSIMSDLHWCNNNQEEFRFNLVDCHIKIEKQKTFVEHQIERIKHPKRTVKKMISRLKKEDGSKK